MKLERKSQAMDKSDVFYVEPRHGHTPKASKFRHLLFKTLPFLLTAALASGATWGIIKYTEPEHFGLAFALKATKGKVALTEKQLRDLVVGEGLVVYWLGPEIGAKYTLTSVTKDQNYVRYLPGGEGLNDAGANFRVVGTYETKDAFLTTEKQGMAAGATSFISPEGHSVYYLKSRPLSVYVGLKETDDQLEIFNPIAGQALADARASGLIQRIK